ncbi:MAG: pseudouridine-5'-phosphate glycosidase [Bacillota bacterium]
MIKHLEISQEVKAALEAGKPVVALESTIISHGMPYPKNVETALKVEDVVREGGAVPATIAIIGGVMKVGLSKDEIELLGKKGLDVAKVSRRDFPSIIANKEDGATTVAGTMIIAALAGVKIFATGGVGGVHRNAETTWDVSADLEELSQTPVMVICAGAKSILDLSLTKEYLETKGVPLLGYQTKELPAFYTRKSGLELDKAVQSPEEFAKMLKVSSDIGFKNGFVVCNPIPEEFSMDPDFIEKIIVEAVAEANKLGIVGKETTPFLLDKIQKLTGGDSLDSNIELVYNNARLASKIAVEYSKL